jgi:osmotically-inducible protein OsmY
MCASVPTTGASATMLFPRCQRSMRGEISGSFARRPAERRVRARTIGKVNSCNVETFKGVVQLSGFVSSQAAANKATEVARSVGGVKSVKNDMRIK